MHNEGTRSEELVADLKRGARIAVVSDAGTPGIADPGGQIASAAIAAGIDVFPVPGANAAISGLIASGLPTENFTFHGFLPAKAGQRKTFLEADPAHGGHPHLLRSSPPHLDTLGDLEAVFGPAQHVVIARELTKLHEEFLRGPVSDLRAQLAARPSRSRGDCSVVAPPPQLRPRRSPATPASPPKSQP